MDKAYLEIQISDIDVPTDFNWDQTKVRVLVDNRTVRDIPLNKLNTIAKTKITKSDELVVLQVISNIGYGKEKEIDCLFLPTEFFLDIPVSSTSTTGLPVRELESWLFFDENGYLKQQPQREGPKGVNIRLQITEFLTNMGSPKKSPTNIQRATTMIEKKMVVNNLSQSSERRD